MSLMSWSCLEGGRGSWWSRAGPAAPRPPPCWWTPPRSPSDRRPPDTRADTCTVDKCDRGLISDGRPHLTVPSSSPPASTSKISGISAVEPGKGAGWGSRNDWSHMAPSLRLSGSLRLGLPRIAPIAKCPVALSSGQAPARPVCDRSTHPPPPVAAIDQRPLGWLGLTRRPQGNAGLATPHHWHQGSRCLSRP